MNTRQPWLIFHLDGLRAAVPIREVREIVRMPPITRVPGGSQALRGVFNLRGRVMPAFDLAERLGLKPGTVGPSSVIIVVQPGGARGDLWGVMVDEVDEVVGFSPDDVQPTATLGALPFEARSLAGFARHGDELVFLLELTHLLGEAAVPPPGTSISQENRP